MTNEEIFAQRAEAKRFQETKLGGLFVKFENLIGRAWITDQRDGASTRAMDRDWAASNVARKELVDAIKEMQRGLDLAISRGCNHCADSIREARAIANTHAPAPLCAPCASD